MLQIRCQSAKQNGQLRRIHQNIFLFSMRLLISLEMKCNRLLIWTFYLLHFLIALVIENVKHIFLEFWHFLHLNFILHIWKVFSEYFSYYFHFFCCLKNEIQNLYWILLNILFLTAVGSLFFLEPIWQKPICDFMQFSIILKVYFGKKKQLSAQNTKL